MERKEPRSVLCLASYEKGAAFMEECKRQDWQVILLTASTLADAPWPHQTIDEFYHMPDLSRVDDVIKAVSYLARSRTIERIIPLDDYDVETAAALREHLRLGGMGATTARNVRDKLAMRGRAFDAGVPVPAFVHTLNHARIAEYSEQVPPPWVLKPRSEVSSIGILKIESSGDLWARLEALGDRQSFFLLERYLPGDVYHVDSILWDRQVIFAQAHRYGRPPMDVFHGGGIASSRTLVRGSDEERRLQDLNKQVVSALGLRYGVSHVEFIRSEADGQFHFLEIGARVGGAQTAEMVEAATGINLWREWARVEIAQDTGRYELPAPRSDYAGVIISLARQEHPDTSAYVDPEIVWRLEKRHHVGFIVASSDPTRVDHLLEKYTRRFYDDFFAALPPWESRPEAESHHAQQEA